ncbi:hypothetical protein DEBA109399_11130 [Dermacoccus barathri]
MPMGPKCVSLFVLCRLDQESLAGLAVFEDSRPKFVANATGHLPHEDPGADLKQPSSEVPSKSRRASSEDNDYHGKSASS